MARTNENQNTRLLLADDHALVRAGLRALVEKIPSVTVVAEANDAREALALIEKHLPDIVLMDVSMPGLNGLEAAARVTRDFPQVKVIIVSMHAKEEYVAQALRAGVSGYVLKLGSTRELTLAIQAVKRGEVFLSPHISRCVIQGYFERGETDPASARQLTPRQREIVRLVAEGKRTKEIAFLLGLSTKTVDAHRAQLMAKLDLHDLPALVRYAMRMGLVPPEVNPSWDARG